MKKLILCAMILLIQGCTTTKPVKELYFKSRLPTMELPFFNKGKGIGLHFEVESQRFTAKMTRNLASDFNFYRDNTYFSSKDNVTAGWDLAVSYARPIAEIPVEAAVSGDFVQLKMGLLGFANDQAIKGMFSVGWYQPARWTEETKCELLDCLFTSPKSIQDAKDIESGIRIESRGNEVKTGLTFSYEIDPKYSALFGAHWMTYNYSATATNLSGTSISFEENFFSSGLGLGAAYTDRSNNIYAALTVDRILMSWNGEKTERFAFGVRTHFGF